ncbi:protein tyrosine kinase, partial [Entamoeba invadens IP1]
DVYTRKTKKLERQQNNLSYVICFLEKTIIKFDKAHATSLTLQRKTYNLRFLLLFKPTTGVLRSNESTYITAIIVPKCSTVFHENIPVTFSFHNLHLEAIQKTMTDNSSTSSEISSKKHKTKRFYTYLNLNGETVFSTKIDFETLTIEKEIFIHQRYGDIYKALWKRMDVVVLTVKTDNLDLKIVEDRFSKELEVMQQTTSRFIVQLLGTSMSEKSFCLVMDYYSLGVLSVFRESHKVSDLMKIRLVEDISIAMEFLHEKQIIHYDFNPRNVVVVTTDPNENVVCKVFDSGISRVLYSLGVSENTKIGTPRYSAPETFKGIPTFMSDVYSFGVTVFEICVWGDAFPINAFPNEEDISSYVLSGKRPEIQENCIFKDLIQNCWNQNPDLRLSFKQITPIVQHISKNYDKQKRGSKDSKEANENKETKEKTSPKVEQTEELDNLNGRSKSKHFISHNFSHKDKHSVHVYGSQDEKTPDL